MSSRGRGRPAAQVSLVIVVVALLALIGVVDRTVPTSSPPPAVTRPVSAVLAADAESSSWYCAGGSGTSGSAAVATVDLVNTTDRRVSGTMTVVTDTGTTRARVISLAGRAAMTVTPSSVVSGAWVAVGLQFEGGGVLATQSVVGPDGWSTAPCSGATASNWYFASGSTNDGNSMYLSLFNPTAATAVVDLSFITPHGVLEPQPFEGVVVPPGGLAVEQIGAYVQDQSSVSTVVSVRAGRIVADEVQTLSGSGVRGVSLRLGVPAPEREWALPSSLNTAGGTTTLSIFNPTLQAQRVTVRVRLVSGPVTPFSMTLLADSTWELNTSAAVRIPTGVSYSAVVHASGGQGVVVDRTVETASGAPTPQYGAQSAVPESDRGATTIVGAPGTPSDPAIAGAGPIGLGLVNLGTGRVAVTVSSYRAGSRGAAEVRRVVLAPSSFEDISTTALRGVDRRPLVVRADGPVAAMLDLGPAGSPGVVSLPAVPVEARAT